jgi:hypothetical protein
VPWAVTVTVAPDMADPDLSRTFPEKLPLACPYIAGHMANKRAKATTKKEALEEILFVKPSAKFRHSALMIMRLITNPFQLLRLKAVLACGRRLQLIEQCTTQATKFSEELNEFEIRRSAPRRQRKVCGST